MELGHAVHGVAADDGEVGHADLFHRAFFNQRKFARLNVITGIQGSHIVQEAAIDFVND